MRMQESTIEHVLVGVTEPVLVEVTESFLVVVTETPSVPTGVEKPVRCFAPLVTLNHTIAANESVKVYSAKPTQENPKITTKDTTVATQVVKWSRSTQVE